MSERIDVRSVNGWGPYCGCGKPSALHVIVEPRIDWFVCATCTMEAVGRYIASTGQPDFSGDRDRDAPPLSPPRRNREAE